MNKQTMTNVQKPQEKFHRFDEFTCTFRDIKHEIIEGRIWNIPNAIMVARLVLGFFIIQFFSTSVNTDPLLAIPFVALMFLLDVLDGTLARKLHQQTLFGKTFDPLVDKILIVYGILTIFRILKIPASLTLPFFSTHLIMLVGSLFLMLTHRALPAVRSYGAVSNVLAVISAIFYWLGSIRIGRKIMILAITSGYALIIDYVNRIKWKKEKLVHKMKRESD